jgi:hypothetical protein
VQHRIPVVFGGNTDSALARVARYGDGWYGFNIPVDELPARLNFLATSCAKAGRDANELIIAVSLCDGSPLQVEDVAAMGVTELVVVGSPPPYADVAAAWVTELAEYWGVGGPTAT